MVDKQRLSSAVIIQAILCHVLLRFQSSSGSTCFLPLPGPQVNPLPPDSDDEDAACANTQSTNASGDALALRQQLLSPSLMREAGRQDGSWSNPGGEQEPAIQDAAAAAIEARSVAKVDAPSTPQGSKLAKNVLSGGPGDGNKGSARKAPAATQQQQKQPFSHGKGKQQGQGKDVAGTEAARAKGPTSTHSKAQQKKQVQGHRGSLHRPEPKVEEDVQSSDSEDYSALKKAAETRGQRGARRGSAGDAEGFEVVSAVRFTTPMQPSRKRQAQRSAGGSRPSEPMRTPRVSKAPRYGEQMEGIDDSWLASIAMR